MINKIMTLEQAVADVRDGMTIMVGGFLATGSPEILMDALVEKGRQAGALTIGDLLTLEKLDLSLEEAERFYDRIERLNIDVAFEEPPAQASDAAEDMTDPGCLLRVLSMYESPEVNRVIRVYRQFRHALGRDPSAEEIAAELHMPVGKVRGLIARAQAPADWETGASEPDHPL